MTIQSPASDSTLQAFRSVPRTGVLRREQGYSFGVEDAPAPSSTAAARARSNGRRSI